MTDRPIEQIPKIATAKNRPPSHKEPLIKELGPNARIQLEQTTLTSPTTPVINKLNAHLAQMAEDAQVEKEATERNMGFTVNGPQILALARVSQGFSPLYRAFKDYLEGPKEKPLKMFRKDGEEEDLGPYEQPARQFESSVRMLILKGELRKLSEVLQQVSNPTPDLAKIIANMTEDLGNDVSVREILMNPDANLVDFISTLHGRPLNEIQLPGGNPLVILPRIGVIMMTSPRHNILHVNVNNYRGSLYSYLMAELPLDRQRAEALTAEELAGKWGDEVNSTSKVDVFDGLVRKYGKVHTHVTNFLNVPRHLGKGVFAGLYVDTFDTSNVAQPVEVPQFQNSPAFKGSKFIHADHTSPILIFSPQLFENHKWQRRHGYQTLGEGITIKDKDFLGIWVSPTYKGHLLKWISRWDQAKLTETFGDKIPDKFFLTTTQDIE